MFFFFIFAIRYTQRFKTRKVCELKKFGNSLQYHLRAVAIIECFFFVLSSITYFDYFFYFGFRSHEPWTYMQEQNAVRSFFFFVWILYFKIKLIKSRVYKIIYKRKYKISARMWFLLFFINNKTKLILSFFGFANILGIEYFIWKYMLVVRFLK